MLTIGTILNSYFSRSSLASRVEDNSILIIPSTTKEAGLYPGCCLAIMKIIGFGVVGVALM